MIQEAPTAPVVTPGVPAELSPAPVTDGKTTERETAPHQERYRPSGRLMWHIAHGEFNGGVYPTKTTSVVSEKSYQALQAQHEDVRKTDSFLRENRVKEWLRGKIPGIQDSDMTSQLLHHAEMEMWAKGEAQAVARMLAAGDSHTAEALQKLGFIIPDNTPDAHSDQALKDALYRSTSDQSGEYGSFYGAFCRSGMDTNKLLAQKLTEEEMDVIKPFLTDILGGETAFQALKALKQTQHAVAILPSEDQTKIYTDEPDFKNDNEQKVFNYFQKGSELAKKQPTPLPAPETVSQPEQNPTPPETTAIPQWPPLDYAKLADEVSLDKFSQNGSIRDLQDAVSNIQPVQLSHDISLEIIYDNLTNRNPPISSPDLEFDANDQAMREYQRYVDTKNQDRDPSQQIPINSTRHDPKSGTTEFFVDRTTIFPFHYVKPINQWADKSPLTRAYITIDPAHARYLYRDFVDLAYTLSDAGIEFEAKAIEPEKLGQRQESMTLYFPEGQQEKAGQIIQTYLTEHPGFAHGHLITALPDTVDGLSWAREPDTVQTNLVREITGTTEHSVSYNEFVSAMTLPFYLQRIEKMYRDAGKTADANIIHQEFERVHAVMQKYTPKQEAEQKLTNAETSREQPKTVEDIRREVFENAGRRSAEEVSQLIGDVQQILTQEKEAGRGKMKATIQEMNDSPDTNQTKPTREGEVVFLPKGAGRLVALGDIHGDLATIQQVLTKEHVLEDLAAGSPVQVVFMGDLVDRGPKDIEVMEAVMMLKKLYPDKITIMKADHETAGGIRPHEFPSRLQNKFGQEKGATLNGEYIDLFYSLPRYVAGANGLDLVHGGPPSQLLNLQELATLSPQEVGHIMDREITWADPADGRKADNLRAQKENMIRDLQDQINNNNTVPYFEPPSDPARGASGAPALTTIDQKRHLLHLLTTLPPGFYPHPERSSQGTVLSALTESTLYYTGEAVTASTQKTGSTAMLRAHQTSEEAGEDAIKFGAKLGSIHTTGKGSPESAYSGGEPHPRYAVFDLGKPITQITPDNIKDVWTAESTVQIPKQPTPQPPSKGEQFRQASAEKGARQQIEDYSRKILAVLNGSPLSPEDRNPVFLNHMQKYVLDVVGIPFHSEYNVLSPNWISTTFKKNESTNETFTRLNAILSRIPQQKDVKNPSAQPITIIGPTFSIESFNTAFISSPDKIAVKEEKINGNLKRSLSRNLTPAEIAAINGNLEEWEFDTLLPMSGEIRMVLRRKQSSQSSSQENSAKVASHDFFEEKIVYQAEEPEVIEGIKSTTTYGRLIQESQGNPQELKDLDDILHGHFRGLPLQVEPIGRNGTNDYKEFQHYQRLEFMRLYKKNPDLALEVLKRHVGLAHGSSSISLIGVLDDIHGGLRLRSYLDANGVPRPMSEEGLGVYGNNIHVNDIAISFDAWFDPIGQVGSYAWGKYRQGRRDPISNDYYQKLIKSKEQELHNEKDQIQREKSQQRIAYYKRMDELFRTQATNPVVRLGQANFPIVYLVRAEVAIPRTNTDPGNVILPKTSGPKTEVGIRDGVSRDDIQIILVPKDKIRDMQTLISQKNLNIAVFPLEDYITEDDNPSP